MQVNRLNQLLFPPSTPTVTDGLPEAADATPGAPRAAATSHESESVRQSPSEAGVRLDLDHSQRTQAPVIYGPDGMFAGKSRMEVANTPAERFVATAVDIMRAYEQEYVQPAAQGPLDRIKQAMSRFSAQA
ncbi:MAG: hypothetical protein H7Y28_11350 [Rhodoferax sp.]|nr:hypothetical protein [Rhodoferax sp.]